MKPWLERLDDDKLALLVSGALFVLCAWPLALTEVPPYQDLANHLAASAIAERPQEYPEVVFNGFLKTNAALYLWDHVVGALVGKLAAARLFAAIVLAANALVFPRVLLVFGDRKKLVVGSFFLAPMVHHWCICLGLLDFALGLPIALLVLVLLEKQRRMPAAARAVLIAVTSVAAWYAHIIPLLMLHLLLFIELVVTARRSRTEAKALFTRALVFVLPGSMLAAFSIVGQLTTPAPVKMRLVENVFLAPWDLAYNLWAEWFYAFTWLSISTLVPCIALAVLAFRRRAERIPFFEPPAFLTFAALYMFVPYIASYWAYANTRIAAFLWMAALVRVPRELPRWALATLGVCTVAYSVSLGVDYVRLEHDRQEFIAGIPYVREHAKLLPLVLTANGTSQNTRNMTHLWGYYVLAKQTSAPLVFASSRLYGVTYRELAHPQLQHVDLGVFSVRMRDKRAICKLVEPAGVRVGDCEETWRDIWREFWRLMEPRFDHVLLWDPTPDVEALVPSSFKVVFRQGKLVILAKPE